MSLSILNNIAALYAQNNLSSSQSSLQNTLNQLSSGSRINSGADGQRLHRRWPGRNSRWVNSDHNWLDRRLRQSDDLDYGKLTYDNYPFSNVRCSHRHNRQYCRNCCETQYRTGWAERQTNGRRS